MFEAQMIPGASGDGSKVLGPWIPREADNAIFTVELIAVDGGTLKVEVFTKNREDTGTPGTAFATIASSLSSPDIVSAETSGLKELIRFKYTVTNAESKWVLFRMLPTIWFDDVDG